MDMTRTPDEIKKGLECCGESQDCTQDNMPKCPYYEKETCLIELVNDALALIQQLQTENAEKDQRIRQLEAERDVLDYTLAGVMHSVDKWLDAEPYKMDGPTGNDAVTRSVLAREIALKAIEQAQAERDAAVADMHEAQGCLCLICKNHKPDSEKKKYICKAFGDYPFEDGPLICGQFGWRGVTKEE